MISVATDSM